MKLWKIYFLWNKRYYKRDIGNKIALTFDDSPSKNTLKILNVLKKYNIKATFFVIGKRIKGNEKILKKIIGQGCEIGNHSYDHYSLIFKNKRFIEREIIKTDIELRRLRIKTLLFRPPNFRYGFNLFSICKRLNKKIIFCDVVSNDWNLKLKDEQVINNVLKNTNSGSIINFHDYLEDIGENERIIKILDIIIPRLKQKYKLETVSELLK